MIPPAVEAMLATCMPRAHWMSWWQRPSRQWGGLSAEQLWELGCRETVLQAHDDMSRHLLPFLRSE